MKKTIDQDKSQDAKETALPAGDDELLRNIKNSLDAQAGSLDGATQSALNQARARAMALAPKTGKPYGFRWQWPAGAIAAALALVVLYPQIQPGRDSLELLGQDALAAAEAGQLEAPAGNDGQLIDRHLIDDEAMALLQSLPGEDLDFYAELEFIEWLEAQESGAGLPGGEERSV